jgi:hypothetical protein
MPASEAMEGMPAAGSHPDPTIPSDADVQQQCVFQLHTLVTAHVPVLASCVSVPTGCPAACVS